MPKSDPTGQSDADVTMRVELQSRRRSERTMTVYRLVKVEHESDQGLGRCRNISDGGMRLDLSIPLSLNDRVVVTMGSAKLAGRVVWLSGNDCGIAFEQPVDSASLLSSLSPNGGSLPTRAPRLQTNLSAQIAYEGGTGEAVVVNDISIRGMKIVSDGNFRPGLKVRVILDNGYEKEAVVRWSLDNIAGVMLLEPFNVEDLGSVERLGPPSG